MTPFLAPWPSVKNPQAAFFDKNTSSEQILEWFKIPVTSISLRQVHSAKVVTVDEPVDKNLEGDALVTKLSGIVLRVFSADCMPLLAFEGNVIGACHAGWRGLSLGVIENWIAALRVQGAQRETLQVAIGPAIGPCHFEVGRDVSIQTLQNIPQKFHGTFTKEHTDPQKIFVDLKEIARFKLMALGLDPKHIVISPECTYCRKDLLPSYRREGKGAGRIQAVITHSRS